jgi:hypothetical protein
VTTKPHDALFRSTFSQPEHAAGELQHLLPPELSARIDWPTLTLVPSSFVDEALRDSQSDLLFTAALDGKEAFIYLLFEHQSTPDALMVFRELKYEVGIWDGWLKEHPKAKKLPVILPILLCHGPSGWSAATRFEKVLDVDDETMALVADFVPKFRVIVDDLADESDEALRGRAMTALGRLVLFCLKTARNTDDLVRGLSLWASVFREVREAPNGRAALALIWRYIWAVHEKPKERILPALLAAADEEQKKDMASLAQQFIDEGIEKGIEKGERGLLLRQLRRRFGGLSADVIARVERAGMAEVERWGDRVLTAGSLAEVLDETS